jgi:hypothetical protein
MLRHVAEEWPVRRARRWSFARTAEAAPADPRPQGRNRIVALFLPAVVVATALTALFSTPSASAASISPIEVPPGGQVTVQVGACPPGNSWLGVYAQGATNQQYGTWIWCTPTWTFTAPTTPGHYEVRGLGNNADGDWYNEQFATVPFRVTGQLCRDFTSTVRWSQVTVGDLINSGVPVPDAARDYLDRPLFQGAAYAQLKGNWCYENQQVVSNTIRPLESALTGPGPLGIILSVQSVATGSIAVENYGNGATRYRVAQSTARVFLSVPAQVNLTIPGTEIGIQIPAGTNVALYDMRMDTLLTGAGNAECAATPACDVVLGTPYQP